MPDEAYMLVLCDSDVVPAVVYVGMLRQALNFADADADPARDRRVKLPRSGENVPEPRRR